MIETAQGSQSLDTPVAEVKDAQSLEAPKEAQPSKFDVMAQKEKQYVRKMQQVKAMEQKIEQERQQIAEMYKKVQEFESTKKQARLNPDKYLESLGLDYEYLTQYKLNNNNPTYDAKIQSLEERLEEALRSVDERDNKRMEEAKQKESEAQKEAISRYQKEISDFVESNKDKYKFVHAYEGVELILGAANEYAQRTGKVMPMDQAADLAENYLKEQWLKGKAFMEEQNPGSKSEDEPRLQAKSLSSSMAPSVNSGVVPAKTDRERMQRALAKLG